MRASEAEFFACGFLESFEVDSFTTARADRTISPVTWKVSRIYVYANAVNPEQLLIVEFAIGEHLLPAFAFDLGMKLPSEITRGLEGDDSHTSILREVNERRCHLSPVAKFERTLPQAASGHHCDGIGSTAIDLDEGDETLPVGAERIFNLQGLEPQKGHTHSEDLASAHVTMNRFSPLEKGVESIHHASSFVECGLRGKWK